MLSNYKKQQAEAVLRNMDREIRYNLEADYICSVNVEKDEKNREAHLDRLMGKLDILRAVKAITFKQQMILMEYYLERRREEVDAA